MPNSFKKLRLGTRGSPLARVQSDWVAAQLKKANPGLKLEIKVITTSGDVSTGDLKNSGGKGLFVKEIEEALLADEIDLAVHSLKDLPGVLTEGLMLAAYPQREDPRDAFVSARYNSLVALPEGGVIGTSSPRRADQLKALRPDCTIRPIRGNVETRLRKIAAGEFDATLLAVAGLNRLGCAGAIQEILSIEKMVPAVGQGVLGIETRVKDRALVGFLKQVLEDPTTALQARCERSLLAAIGGDCFTPLAGYSEVDGNFLRLTGWLRGVQIRKEGSTAAPELLGEEVARVLLQ